MIIFKKFGCKCSFLVPNKKKYNVKEVLDVAYRGNLNEGDGDVEEVVHVGEPDHAHIRHNHRPQVPLVAAQGNRSI